jgi:hypothetical protein
MVIYPVEIDANPVILTLGRYLLRHWIRWQFPSRRLASPGLLASVHERCGPAAFILSSPRAGSTLLRLMLAGHPDLFCPPEFHLFATASMAQRRAVENKPELNAGIQAAIARLVGRDEGMARDIVAAFEQDDARTIDVFRYIVDLARPRLVVDKSPGNARYIETLKAIESNVEAARYVFLVRHPYAVIESMVRTRIAQLMDGAGELDPFWFGEHAWDYYNSNILEFLKGVATERYCMVRYENLMREPRRVMNTITRTLGVEFSELVLHPFDGDRMRDGPGDPGLTSRSSIDDELGEVWRQIRLPRALNRITRDLAAELGYELPHDPAPRVQREPFVSISELPAASLDSS